MTTTLETVEYYESLLTMQYLNLPNATGVIAATVTPVLVPQQTQQTITLSGAPVSGTYKLVYAEQQTAAINPMGGAAAVQTALNNLLYSINPVLNQVSVIAEGFGYLVSFDLVAPVVPLLTVAANTTGVTITIGYPAIDEIIPLAVQNAFNLNGDNTAVGVQLDTLGKYAGVSRSGSGFSTSITLSDNDYFVLVKLAIAKNSAGSSLSDIQTLINTFFGTSIQVFDYQNMMMSYFIDALVGSTDLVQLVITDGLLPRPMGVGLTVFYPASLVFSFRTVQNASPGWPFNTVAAYDTTWQWLSSHNLIGAYP